MPKSVIQCHPNITPDHEVLLFVDMVLVEHYPFYSSLLIGKSFAEICSMLDVTLPDNCSYAYYRYFNHTSITLKEFGRYNSIINSKHILKDYGQNS